MKVGIIRQLSTDPNITSPRGYLKIVKNDNELNTANVFAPSELLTPFSAQRDDAPRIAMSSTQSKHIIPTEKSHPVLIGNGMEKVLPKILSNDFCFKADEAGEVVERNEANNLLVLKYKDGRHDIINLNAEIEKNGNGGFYISNKLESNLKVGYKFKKGDVLAINRKFFTDDKEPTFKLGPLTKIAILNAYYTYEDALIITEKLSDMLATEVLMQKECTLGKNSNVQYIVKKGQKIEVGEPLLIFERSYEDSDVNKLLTNIGDELGEDILSLGKIPVKSKYSGTVEDIRIYYNVDLSELSPSLRRLTEEHIKNVNKIKNSVKKYMSDDVTMVFEPTEKIESPDKKIKGVPVDDGVLIEFYIKYKDKAGIGD